jgi:hypothetical protein
MVETILLPRILSSLNIRALRIIQASLLLLRPEWYLKVLH